MFSIFPKEICNIGSFNVDGGDVKSNIGNVVNDGGDVKHNGASVIVDEGIVMIDRWDVACNIGSFNVDGGDVKSNIGSVVNKSVCMAGFCQGIFNRSIFLFNL